MPWPCRTLGTTQGARFRALYGCMYFSMMRPSLVAMLREHIARSGAGRTGASSVPSAATRSRRQRGGRYGRRSGPPRSPLGSLTGRS